MSAHTSRRRRNYLRACDTETRTDERFDEAIGRNLPRIADTVVAAAAMTPDAIRRYATPATARALTEAGIAIEFGDDSALALDLYNDIRSTLALSPERRYDTHVRITLTPWRSGRPSRGQDAMFLATEHWQYRARNAPRHHRFVCVPSTGDAEAAYTDPTTTRVWIFEPTRALTAKSREVFRLLSFTAGNQAADITHHREGHRQTYLASLPEPADTEPGALTTITYTFQALLPAAGHLLKVDVDKPTKGIQVDLTHADTDIHRVNLTHRLGTTAGRLHHGTPDTPASISIGHDGLVLPGAGLAYTWTLADEL